MKNEDVIDNCIEFSFTPFNLMGKTKYKILRGLLLIAGFIWFVVTAFPLMVIILICTTSELINNPD